MYIVKQLLDSKGYDVWSIAPDASIYSALELMAEKNVGALLVMEGDRLAGIFSERDYARRVVLQGRTSRDTAVREAMTSQVICVPPDHTVQECMALMTAKRIRHLPVLDGDRVIGVISIGDVVKAYIAQQEVMINHLENYITTGYG